MHRTIRNSTILGWVCTQWLYEKAITIRPRPKEGGADVKRKHNGGKSPDRDMRQQIGWSNGWLRPRKRAGDDKRRSNLIYGASLCSRFKVICRY